MSRTACVLIIAVVFAVVAAEAPLQAYLDPGAGSMVLQVLLGGVAGVAVLLKLSWRRITEPFRKRVPPGEPQI